MFILDDSFMIALPSSNWISAYFFILVPIDFTSRKTEPEFILISKRYTLNNAPSSSTYLTLAVPIVEPPCVMALLRFTVSNVLISSLPFSRLHMKY